ncbi:MAG: hypothetical protein WAO75_10395, partial [Atribacterales bacterium]
CGPLVEPFRNDPFFVIPEIFSRESMFLFFLWFLNTYGPRLKDCRGDEEVGIQRFSNTYGPRLKDCRGDE